MNFGESVFSAGFNQITAKENLIVKGNYGILPRYQRGKTLEGSRRRITKAGLDPLPCGAARPVGGAGRPLWAPPVSLLQMSVSHRLLGCISTVL